MKLYTTALILGIAAFAFTSCKKEHDCKCYSQSLNRSVTFKVNGKKSDAKDKCKDQPVTGQYTGTDFQCNLD